MDSEKEKSVENNDAVVSKFVDDSIEDLTSGVFSQAVQEVITSDDTMVPTFVFSSPQRFTIGLPKGKSKTNLSKGKRALNHNARFSTFIDGDNLSNLDSSKSTQHKIYYEKAQTSQIFERFNHIKTALVLRIEEMHAKKLFTLSDCVQVFLSEYIPISMSIPRSLSCEGISNLLQIESDSSFVKAISVSLELQELMRRTMLEVKTLPVCCCGYIYIHPNLCFSKHPSDPTLIAGKITNVSDNAIVINKKDVISQLNTMRFFLEMLYEYYTNK